MIQILIILIVICCYTHAQQLLTVKKQYIETEEDLKTMEKILQHRQSGKKIAYISQNKAITLGLEQYFQNLSDWLILNQNQTLFKYEADFIWMNSDTNFEYNRIPPNSVFNHIKHWQYLGNKVYFTQALKEFDKQKLYDFNSSAFYPSALVLNFSKPKFTEEELYFIRNEKQGLWILKPMTGLLGQNIQIYNNITKLKEFIIEKKPLKTKKNPHKHCYVLQQYQKDIHLISESKYNIRVYLVVAWNHPRFVLYRDGYVIVNPQKYEISNLDMSNDTAKLVHIANIQNVAEASNKTEAAKRILLIKEYKEILKSQDHLTDQQIDQIFHKIKKYMTYTFMYSNQLFRPINDSFMMLGYDILIDSSFEPKILEVNGDPGMRKYSQSLSEEYDQIVKEYIGLVLQFQENGENNWEILKHPENINIGKMEIIYNEIQNYSYIDQYQRNSSNFSKQDKSFAQEFFKKIDL